MKTKTWIFYVSHAHSFRSFCTAHFTRQNCQSHIHLPLLVPWTNSLIYTPRFLCSHLSTHIILLHQNYLYSFCHAPNPTIKIGTWQPPHAYEVSTLKVCKAFLATKIYPQKLKSNKSKYLNNFFMNRSPII